VYTILSVVNFIYYIHKYIYIHIYIYIYTHTYISIYIYYTYKITFTNTQRVIGKHFNKVQDIRVTDWKQRA